MDGKKLLKPEETVRLNGFNVAPQLSIGRCYCAIDKNLSYQILNFKYQKKTLNLCNLRSPIKHTLRLAHLRTLR